MRRSTRLGAILLMGAVAGCGSHGESKVPPARTLSGPNAADFSPSFSPGGRHVAYIRAGAHDWNVTIADSDLSHPVTVDSSAAQARGLVWSPDGSRLAYSIGENYDIWTAPAEGGSRRQLTSRKGLELAIQWQPGGAWLTYVATGKGGEVASYQIDVATGRSVPFPAPAQPAIGFRSPDGSAIAYNVIRGGKGTIWVADSLGEHARQLTSEGFESFSGNGTPWSPDGSELLYESRRTGLADVWVLRLADDSARQLTRDVRQDQNPVWSPDGTWVAFLSDRGQQTDVWIIPAAAGRPERVTDDPAPESDLQWVGQKNELAFTTGRQGSALWTHALASGAERQLTPDSIRVGAYDLSSDRTRIVFVALRGGGVRDLDLLDLGTGDRRTLVANGAQNTDPVWSPDGSEIAFTSNKTGNLDVWLVDASGGSPRDVTGWPGTERAAQWSADGTSLYFVSDREAHPISDLWEVASAGGQPHRLTQLGFVFGDVVTRPGGDVLVLTAGGSEGQVSLTRLLPDGTLQPLWDRTNVLDVPDYSVTPNGDSIAIPVAAQGGGSVTMLLPTHGGRGRQILGADAAITGWSSDGARAVYYSGSPNADLWVTTVRDSSVRRVTETPSDESGRVLFLEGDTSLVFSRTTTGRRIVTADVGRLMAADRSR